MIHDHPALGTAPNARSDAKRRLRIALAIALVVLVVELIGAIVSNSLALAADAGHVLSDSAAVGLALGAIWLAGRPAGSQRTFGWYRAEIIAAAINGTGLLVIAAVLIWQAVGRISSDPQIDGRLLLIVAAAGLLANLVSAALLHQHQEHNLNIRGAYYHVLGDALGSVAALTAGVIILTTGWVAIDLVASLLIAVLIIVGAIRLLIEAANVLLEAAPPGLTVAQIEVDLTTLPGVRGVHDLHLWTVTSGFASLSAHLEIADDTNPTAVLILVAQRLRHEFGLEHVTLQPETAQLHAAMECCHFLDSAAATQHPTADAHHGAARDA